MKKNYFLFGFLCLTAFSFAQKNIYYTELQPDSTNSHYVRSFDKIGNNGYVICSQSSYYTSENDVLLTVTDKDGLQIGSINYDFGASEDGGDVISTSDGGFLFSGSTGGSFLSGIPTEALVVKVDSAGTIQWSKKAVDTTNLIYSIAKDLVENPNGTFTILGEANGNLFLWNLDGSGDTVWTTLYQDSVFEVPKRLLRHSNGDFTILSRTVSQGMLAPYIIRVDANGDKLWSKIYNTGADFGPEGIIESSDGGYVVVGHIKTQITPTIDADAATMKLDASGSVKWLVSHGKYQPNKASSEEGFGLTETFDGGYAIAGLTNSYSNLSGFQDIYFYKLDSAGTLLWTKLYGESDGTNNAAVDVFENTDSTLSIAGRHMTNPPFIFFQSHTFILKTSFRGDIGCLEKDSLPDTTNTYSVVVTIPNESIMSYANTQDIMGVKTFEPLTQVTTCINADTSTYYACTSSVVINEVHIRPTGFYGQKTREFIELYNTSGTDTIDLTGWYLRTDLNNDVSNPDFGDVRIVTWADRFPGTSPFDSVAGWLDTNSILIPPNSFALILEPNWNDSININDRLDIPDSTIILTCDSFLYWGSNSSDGNQPNNGLLQNKQDFVSLYDGDPSLGTSNNIDSVGWNNGTVKVEEGFSLQRDNDCAFRWHYLDTVDTSAGYLRDTDSSLLLPFSIGSLNFIGATISSNNAYSCTGDLVYYSFPDNGCIPYNYLWSFDDPGSGASDTSTSSSPNHIFDTPGVFNVSLIISNACHIDTLYYITTIYNSLYLNLGNDTVLCAFDTITLNASNIADSVLWSTGDTSQTINVTDTGTYFVTCVNSSGCQVSDTIIIGNVAVLADAGITPTGATNAFFSWVPSISLDSSTVSNPTAMPTETTMYTVTVTEGNCSSKDSILVSVLNYIADAGSDTEICQGNSVIIGGSPTGPSGSTYNWTAPTGLDNASTANPVATPLLTTTYLVAVNTGCGNILDSVTIKVNSLPLVDAGNDTTIFLGSSIVLMGTGGTSYQWNPQAGLSCSNCANPTASPSSSTTYYLMVTDANGCQSTDEVTIAIEPVASIIFVPNIFSPNGDGLNEVLDVQGSGYESVYFAVYDRWGEKVFETTSIDTDWDGTFRGKHLNSATFVYLLEVVYIDGEAYTEKGNVALVR